ncbi:protein S100-P-like [Anableps anableps]
MSQLEITMASLIQTFDKYATSEGKKDTLSKAELKTLIEKELSQMLKAPKNPGEVDKLMQSLDFNGDAEVDFREFVILVASLTCAAHRF